VKDMVLTAVKISGIALRFASDTLKQDKEVVLEAVKSRGDVLRYAADIMKQDKEVVLAAVTTYCDALQYVDQKAAMWAEKEFVLAMVQLRGCSFKYAADSLKSDKEFVLEVVKIFGNLLNFAMNSLNQDPDCLKAAGLWDEGLEHSRSEKGIMSVKFSLGEETTTYATDFVKAMKKDTFLQQFDIFFPNTRCKSFCGEELAYTNMDNPCRGTQQTCTLPDSKNLTMKDGKWEPGAECCWRFAFRFRQEECRETNGFMIQVEECNIGLGRGQMLETAMAKEVGMKVFRTYTDRMSVGEDEIGRLSKKIEEWYQTGCANMDLENVYIGFGYQSTTRAQYEKL